MAPAGSYSDDAVSRIVGELQRKLEARVRESSEEMLHRLEEMLRLDVSHLVEEITPPPAPAHSAEELLAAIRRIDAETTQTDILKALVEEARRFASRSAFFLTRVGEVRGWAGAGWNSAAASLEELCFDLPDEGVWAELARGTGAVRLDAEGCREVAERFAGEAGSEGILVPFVLRGKLAGTLYADRAGDGAEPDFASLQLLTHAAAQALETVAFRDRGASPALRAFQDAGGLPLWQPVGAPAPAAPPPEVDEEIPEAVAPEEPPPDEAELSAFEAVEEPAYFEPVEEPVEEPVPEFAESEEAVDLEYVEPPAEPEPEAVSVADDVFATEYVEPAVEDEAEIWEEDDEPTAISRGVVAEPPELAFEEAAGQQTVQLDSLPPVAPPAPEFEAEAEVSGFEIEPEPPAAPVPPPPLKVAPPVAAPAPAKPSPPAGSTEVRPPDDLEGPGLAFSSKPLAAGIETDVLSAGDEALHEEARRLARLLVSEIKLYNEEVIEEGRMAGNIYSRLREDIDRSRQMYDERIDPRIQEDYFYQELVQRLAGGDPKLLGM